MRSPFFPALSASLVALSVAALTAQVPTTDADLVRRARAVHERVITLDTHVDINPAQFTLQHPNYADRLSTQVNLPKMREGGLDAAFLYLETPEMPMHVGSLHLYERPAGARAQVGA